MKSTGSNHFQIDLALLSSPARILPSLNIPKINCADPGWPWFTAGKIEFVSEIIIEIEAVVNDVSLVHRENGIPGCVWTLGHHAMRIDRY